MILTRLWEDSGGGRMSPWRLRDREVVGEERGEKYRVWTYREEKPPCLPEICEKEAGRRVWGPHRPSFAHEGSEPCAVCCVRQALSDFYMESNAISGNQSWDSFREQEIFSRSCYKNLKEEQRGLCTSALAVRTMKMFTEQSHVEMDVLVCVFLYEWPPPERSKYIHLLPLSS